MYGRMKPVFLSACDVAVCSCVTFPPEAHTEKVYVLLIPALRTLLLLYRPLTSISPGRTSTAFVLLVHAFLSIVERCRIVPFARV